MRALACIQIDYRAVPKWNLYRADVMGSAVEDVLAAVGWLQGSFGREDATTRR